ncbi:pyridoxamine 5'-phosphate oxidase family protein [Streptomyces syringium]|uniref:pyridoxamine 5'-phosphate oxidase family protein n=1 Tax=Streptomyces syringium TaxID=76729 RepID=UPI0033CFA823
MLSELPGLAHLPGSPRPTGPSQATDRLEATDERRALDLLARTPYGRASVSMRALPFVTVARHIVVDAPASPSSSPSSRVLLRLHGGFGYAQACDGSVVAYSADNLSGRQEGDEDVWTVQFVGMARLFTPSAAEIELFGRPPRTADGVPFHPEYLCIEPQFISLHHLEGVPARQFTHSP